ncbi:hypothetical protein ISF_08750 [Cordyceps fumosorosea ARSEF 2679]|uniref:Uncharacterized protein n=1 Tax=Cordyceps fumosorosea (strain ARSEF 2679) TaxID=1081104 RepID=A0A167LR38_CORFA|nr:hypothetical protein ISF_08750 [Cordyceps fumosorosea ARSEF 2679]OAA53397.1 hypothetical protein ISF_08750 [Cordyceps fumosorosea ARSEF 2679]
MKLSIATITLLAATALAHPTAPSSVDRRLQRNGPRFLDLFTRSGGDKSDTDPAPKNSTATATPTPKGNSTASTPTPTPTPTAKPSKDDKGEGDKKGSGGGGIANSLIDTAGGLLKGIVNIFGKRVGEGLVVAPIAFGEMNRQPLVVPERSGLIDHPLRWPFVRAVPVDDGVGRGH